MTTSLRAASRRYMQLLEARPMLVKMGSAGAIASAGDCAAQAADPRAYDGARTLTMAAAATCLHAPLWHLWFQLLDRRLLARARGPASAVALQKVCVEAVTAAPAVEPSEATSTSRSRSVDASRRMGTVV